MTPTVDIVVIGHLSRNTYWGEEAAVRPPLATSTLIRCGGKTILVDPSMPGDLMRLRLFERSGLRPEHVDIVFLTSLHPTHRRGLDVFDDAEWVVSGDEREAVGGHLQKLLESDDAAAEAEIEAELAVIGRTRSAAEFASGGETLIDGVHLFPCPGVTPGSCGLLVAGLQTTVITGDAVLTREHFERGAVSETAVDATAAAQSIADIFEVADFVVPGHDNVFPASINLRNSLL